MIKCRCRNCGKVYDESKSRADWKGYCSAKCQHEKAKALGYRKGKEPSEYRVLKSNNQIGSVLIPKELESTVETGSSHNPKPFGPYSGFES